MGKQWGKSIAYWWEAHTLRVSVVFTWHLPDALRFCRAFTNSGVAVLAGGPAVDLMPSYLTGAADVGGALDALWHHNSDATFTTRGCIRRCSFCAVPKIEGDFRELEQWEPRPIICDNNLLAASRAHFDRVIDRLKRFRGVDFNQGLDFRLIKPYHLDRLRELPLVMVRFAWDDVNREVRLMDAVTMALCAGIPRKRLRVYVLIGFQDEPTDALYRLEALRKMGIRANPMRYQPLDAVVKDSYVAPGWTDHELRRMMRYWSRQNWLSKVPYSEFGMTS